MRQAVIIEAVRTPIGRIRGGLSAVRPDDLLALVLEQAVRRAGVDPAEVDEVIAGCANQAGEDNRNVARNAWLIAGFPYPVPCMTVNRLCASGLDAVIAAVRSIQVGDSELAVAAGVESMTRAPFALSKAAAPWAGKQEMYDTSLGWRFPNPRLAERFPLESMGETAENIAERYGIGREAQDAFALASHQRAVAAWEAGRFAAEVVPVPIPNAPAFARDEGPRADSSLAKLAKLEPAFRKGGSVTAGSSSSLNDGAAALVLTTLERARALGKTPLARFVACGNAGVDPRLMGLGPVPATKKALARAGLSVRDVDLVELNEAFAVQALAVARDLELDGERLNVNGGAIALGHPLGASGARILTTLLYEMRRRDVETGLASLCVGVGQGTSVIVRRE